MECTVELCVIVWLCVLFFQMHKDDISYGINELYIKISIISMIEITLKKALARRKYFKVGSDVYFKGRNKGCGLLRVFKMG